MKPRTSKKSSWGPWDQKKAPSKEKDENARRCIEWTEEEKTKIIWTSFINLDNIEWSRVFIPENRTRNGVHHMLKRERAKAMKIIEEYDKPKPKVKEEEPEEVVYTPERPKMYKAVPDFVTEKKQPVPRKKNRLQVKKAGEEGEEEEEEEEENSKDESGEKAAQTAQNENEEADEGGNKAAQTSQNEEEEEMGDTIVCLPKPRRNAVDFLAGADPNDQTIAGAGATTGDTQSETVAENQSDGGDKPGEHQVEVARTEIAAEQTSKRANQIVSKKASKQARQTVSEKVSQHANQTVAEQAKKPANQIAGKKAGKYADRTANEKANDVSIETANVDMEKETEAAKEITTETGEPMGEDFGDDEYQGVAVKTEEYGVDNLYGDDFGVELEKPVTKRKHLVLEVNYSDEFGVDFEAPTAKRTHLDDVDRDHGGEQYEDDFDIGMSFD